MINIFIVILIGILLGLSTLIFINWCFDAYMKWRRRRREVIQFWSNHIWGHYYVYRRKDENET